MIRDKQDLIEEAIERGEHLALCPLDGRYADIGKALAPYFSEYALVKNRVKVEVYWLMFLLNNLDSSEVLNAFKTDSCIRMIYGIYSSFNEKDYFKVKEFESVTNHDVKAVELFVAEKVKNLGYEKLTSFVHIGCTSEDINNTSYAMMIDEVIWNVWDCNVKKLLDILTKFAEKYANTPMLAHTHGQPATPTTVGKEIAVYVSRLRQSKENVKSIKIKAKFNGATGNYSAISTAFPSENWPELCKTFVEDYLELHFNPITTQIESHDYICHIVDGIRHFNNVLRDFDLDMWLYISMDYFKQIVVKDEVGSSTMPHKVNPIRFENSEANIKMSNGICSVLSDELPRSRMQRDLSDSSLQRNIGLAFGYSIQAIRQTTDGMKKVDANEEKLKADLDDKWEVLAEPIQTMLRKYGISDAYNQLKELTRGQNISKEAIHEFVKSLDILSEEDRNMLLELTPSTYVGLADRITWEALLI